MNRKRGTKSDRGPVERAAEHFAVSLGAVSTVRAVRTQWQRQDLFGCDVLGLRENGDLIGIQATSGENSAVTARRRKLEAHPWAASALVLVVQLRKLPDPANARRLQHFFRVHEYALVGGRRAWGVWNEAPAVPREWFKAMNGQAAEENTPC